jgi:hypothetical protein
MRSKWKIPEPRSKGLPYEANMVTEDEIGIGY